MSAIADVFIAIFALIIEALIWSLVATYVVLKAVFTRKGRADLCARWARSRKDRALLVIGPVLWVPVFAVGFGIGLPLVYQMLNERSQAEEIELKGTAEMVFGHPELEDSEIHVRIDQARIFELSDTKDIPELMEKAREISEIEVRKRKAIKNRARNDE